MNRRRTSSTAMLALLVLTTTSPTAALAQAKTPAPQAKPSAEPPLPADGFEIVATYPHDAKAFTQGLVLHGGRMLESQGHYGKSAVSIVELASGNALRRFDLESRYFAEGVTVLRGIVYLVTWKENTGFFFASDDLRLLGKFQYPGVAWGLTHDGTHLIVSDGGDELRFLDPNTFQLVRKVAVRALGKPVYMLNELERVRGEIWANMWHSDRIARIDPKTGNVLGWIDLTGLLPAAERKDPENVLNGIAWDAERDRVFVTGKRWPKLFEIRVKKKE